MECISMKILPITNYAVNSSNTKFNGKFENYFVSDISQVQIDYRHQEERHTAAIHRYS